MGSSAIEVDCMPSSAPPRLSEGRGGVQECVQSEGDRRGGVQECVQSRSTGDEPIWLGGQDTGTVVPPAIVHIICWEHEHSTVDTSGYGISNSFVVIKPSRVCPQ